MRVKRSWAAILLLLLPCVAWTQESDEPSVPPEQEEPPAAAPPEGAPPALEPETAEPVALPSERKWHYLTRVEATSWTLRPRAGVGSDEGFVQVEPTLIIDGGEEFGVNVGAPVRLRLWGGGAGANLVRLEDWDTLSDWGQLVRGLKLGSDFSPLAVWLGALEDYTLLSGHLGAAEMRRRFLGGKLYAMGTAGTLLFPKAEGTLLPGAFASMGLRVDHAR